MKGLLTRATLLGLAGLTASACVSRDPREQCAIASRTQALQAQDRNIVGAGGAYEADTSLQARREELYRSQAARRQVAWQTVAKVLAPVGTAQEPTAIDAELPLWRTWYGGDEVQRLFQELYAGLPAEARATHARFAQADIDDAFGWNAHEVEELDNWPQERRDAYLAALDSQEKWDGIAGIGRASFSPDATRHLLRSYPEVLECMRTGVPAAVEAGQGAATQQALREPIVLSSCEAQSVGPFFVTQGQELHAALDMTGGALRGDGAALRIYTRDAQDQPICAAQGSETCTASADEALFVRVEAGPDGLEAALQVDYKTAEPAWAACLESAFPQTAVIIKADWRRAQFGFELPSYDTSAAALSEALAHDGEMGWGQGQRQSDPGPDDIYTVTLPNGQRYRLAALHIMTKELEHWQWITLWWSDAPDSDFGEDRPQALADRGVWRNYKMCTVTDFSEGDRDASGGFAQNAPTLAAALEAVHGGVGAPSWCSNPYLEQGAHNMGSNCIGCHQHGGVDVRAEEIIGDEDNFPDQGRSLLRNNFPHDYTWALSDGDKLGLAFKAVVDYFDAP